MSEVTELSFSASGSDVNTSAGFDRRFGARIGAEGADPVLVNGIIDAVSPRFAKGERRVPEPLLVLPLALCVMTIAAVVVAITSTTSSTPLWIAGAVTASLLSLAGLIAVLVPVLELTDPQTSGGAYRLTRAWRWGQEALKLVLAALLGGLADHFLK